MNKIRWSMLMKYPEFYELTEEEVDSGWHYCPEFHYLLVGPGMEEWDMCDCFIKQQEDDSEREDSKGKDEVPRVSADDDADR